MPAKKKQAKATTKKKSPAKKATTRTKKTTKAAAAKTTKAAKLILPKKKTAPAKANHAAKRSAATKATRTRRSAPRVNKETASFPIVGIGASAGGLEALETFFTHMPHDSNTAFVIIQHLSPSHKSIMGSILSKCTKMQVLEMEDGMHIEPNRVYMNPPNKNVVIIKGTLQLMDPVKTNGINLPIDCFFRSMAEDLAEKAICIILSGTATDGTLGIKAVKGEGGIAWLKTWLRRQSALSFPALQLTAP
jgi:two-component system CheB/CheR fusion protein